MTEKPTDTDILNRTRILALDDEPVVLEAYRQLYQARVETASSVAAGLGRLRKDEDLRVVVLDFDMRDGGLPFLTTMKRRFPERLTIVLAKSASVLDPLQVRELGVFRCLEKSSATFDVLEDTIKEAIGLLRVRARTG
jgi:DNA-binding NtrC family response regulator